MFLNVGKEVVAQQGSGRGIPNMILRTELLNALIIKINCPHLALRKPMSHFCT